MTPYNTGKVQIGIYYERKPQYWLSRDMAELQRGLLQKNTGQTSLIWMVYVSMVVLGLVWVIR